MKKQLCPGPVLLSCLSIFSKKCRRFPAFFLMSAACLMTAWTVSMEAQPGVKTRPDKTVFLYLDEPAAVSDIVTGKEMEALGLEMKVENGLSGNENIPDNGNIGNISDKARFDLYFPKKPNGQMVIVCPGGGYTIVSSYNEGVYVADWMTSHGVTVAVAKYRLPNGHWTVPLDDIHEIFRYCRAHAEEWGISQIGVMGFYLHCMRRMKSSEPSRRHSLLSGN